MSLMLPRLIDDLEGRVNNSGLIYLKGMSQTAKEEFLAFTKLATVFDFGHLPVTEYKEGAAYFHTPKLTEMEIEAWEKGLIPLPHPVCWYEFTLEKSRTGIMIVAGNLPGQTLCQRVDYDHKQRTGVFTGIWSKCQPGDVEGGYTILATKEQQEVLKIFYREHKADDAVLSFGADHYLAIYFTMMLMSRSTEISVEPAPEKLNKARIKRGDCPLPTHRIVTLVPNKYIHKGEDKGGTHASPRLHWRRSHLRHFEHQTANAKWLPNELYNGTTGWWVTLIARQLVGVRELGEVTQEYKVKLPQQENA